MEPEIDENVLETSVVKTVRNLKKKHSTITEDENGETSARVNSATSAEKKVTSQTQSDAEGFPTTIVNKSLPSSTVKKTKVVRGLNMSITASPVDNNSNTPSGQEGKVGVFARLAMTKAQQNMLKESKKAAKKEAAEVNFFDNAYTQTIMDLVESVLDKSKAIKSLAETNEISYGYINKHTIHDNHFNICFKMFLTQLYKSGEINAEFRNMNKSNFLKLEKFLLEKIESRLRLDGLEVAIKDHYKNVERINEHRLRELASKMSN